MNLRRSLMPICNGRIVAFFVFLGSGFVFIFRFSNFCLEFFFYINKETENGGKRCKWRNKNEVTRRIMFRVNAWLHVGHGRLCTVQWGMTWRTMIGCGERVAYDISVFSEIFTGKVWILYWFSREICLALLFSNGFNMN